jgi:hypothetical protein
LGEGGEGFVEEIGAGEELNLIENALVLGKNILLHGAKKFFS